MVEILELVTSYLVLSSIIPLGLFIWRYTTKSPFTLTQEGKNVLFGKIAILLILGAGAISLFFEDYAGRVWVRLVLYLAVVTYFWIDVILLIRIQRKYPYRRRPRKK